VTGRLLGELLGCIDRHLYPGLIKQLNTIQGMRVDSNGVSNVPGKASEGRPIKSARKQQETEKKKIKEPAHPSLEVIDSLKKESRVGVGSPEDGSNLDSIYITKWDLEGNEAFKEELALILRNENREAARRVGLQIHPEDLNKQVGCILNVFGIKRKSKETTGKVRAYRLELDDLEEQLLLTSTYYHRTCERIQLDNELDAILEAHCPPEMIEFENENEGLSMLQKDEIGANRARLE
jgi:hypothetical protein